MTQSMSNITVSGQLDKQQVASQVVSAPGSEVYDVKTSMVSLVRCKSMAAKKNKRTIYMLVSEENTITTDSTTSDGKPIMVLEQEFYLPLMNLIKSAEAKLRMVQQQLDNVTIERDLYKTTLDTLKTNGIIN